MAQSKTLKQKMLQELKKSRADYKTSVNRIKKIERMDKALGDNKGMKSLSKKDKDIKKTMESYKKIMKSMPKAKMAKRVVKKSLAKRLVGRGLSKAIPGVGAAIVARDVVKAISKKTCISKGGKIVNGKCKGGKKDNRKITSPKARDLKSKR